MIRGKKILIIGGSSLLGKYLLQQCPEGNYVTATWHKNFQPGIDWQMDIADASQIRYVMDTVRPDHVILCSAIGSVDYCEKNYQEAWKVNVDGTSNVVNVCEEYGANLMFVSSNAVFGGDNAPYSEDDATKPVNRYGRMKAEAENIVRANVIRHHIVRPIMLYGWPHSGGRGNWLTYVTESLRAGKDMHVVDDVITQPTYARSCANVMWRLLDEEYGTWHVAAEETMSLWEFARQIAYVWGYDRNMVHQIHSDDPMLANLAPRPVNPTYCLDKLHSLNVYLSTRTVDGLRRAWRE